MLAKYEPRGLLALAPQAFGMVLVGPFSPPATTDRDGVAIVPVRGALMHHEDPLCDSYDSIRARVEEALAKRPKAVVLRIDSPGGLVAGCLELANDLRASAARAGVPLLAYVDGQACSAAYALACAATRIVLPATGAVGSIGVIDALVDITKQDAAMGQNWTLVASGQRKTDGNPHAATTDAAVAAVAARVNELAGVFFEVVATHRGVDVAAVRSLEARVVHGREAVALGLADEVGSFDQLLASVASQAPGATGSEDTMDEEKMRASLKAVLDDEKSDEKAKAKARRMLAAMDEKDDEDEKAKAAKAAADEEAAKRAKAESDKKDEEARAAAAAAAKAQEDEDAKATALRALQEAHALRVERNAEKEAAERQQLLATRPDLDEKTVAFLNTLPIAKVREAVDPEKGFPRGPARPANAAAATATVPATRGATQGTPDASSAAHELDVAMGLARPAQAIRHDGTRLVLGVMTPAEAKAYAAEKQKAQAGTPAR